MLSFDEFFPACIKTLVSDRAVDFAFPQGQSLFTKQQKEYLAPHLKMPIKAVINILQVHGDRVLVVKKENLKDLSFPLKADSVVTDIPNVLLPVRTADCLPIFIYDAESEAIGMVHAGWRGSEKKIVLRTIEKMQEHWSCRAPHLQIAFGPAIRGCCYKVGPEFKNIFPHETIERENGIYLDLALVNKNQLLQCGIKELQIYDCQICTFCDPKYFSFRREGETAGRMISVMIKNSRGDSHGTVP